MGKDVTLGEYLRYLRTEHGYTQQDIADKLGIHRSTYTYYENGKTEPNLDIVKKLTEIYNIPADDIIMNNKSRSEIVADTKLTLAPARKSKAPLTNVENELIEKFRDLNTEEREGLLEKLKEYVAGKKSGEPL